jgi:hypothetical protein
MSIRTNFARANAAIEAIHEEIVNELTALEEEGRAETDPRVKTIVAIEAHLFQALDSLERAEKRSRIA